MVTISESSAALTAEGEVTGTVLVIDDERGPRESLRIVLKTDYRVLCADSVDAGIEILKRDRPDVIVMDIRMPGKNGIEGLRAIRTLDSQVSVVMLTGFGALETAQEAIRLGANDYLKKPFDVGEIQEVIRRYMTRTRIERRRRMAEDELKELNQRLKEEMARKDHLAVMGQRSAELVHDLKNPLTAVLGYLDLLTADLKASRDKLGGQLQDAVQYLGNIEESVLRCRDLSEMWLNASRGTLNKTAVRIRTLVHGVVRECQHLADERRVHLSMDAAGEDVEIAADQLQITRVVQNLVVNALEAVRPHEGRVRVCCQSGPGRIDIRVEDNGCGMDADQAHRAFEPFFTTKKGSGTGLGLFIAQQAVQAHGGSIRIESETGKGTTVSVSLPVN